MSVSTSTNTLKEDVTEYIDNDNHIDDYDLDNHNDIYANISQQDDEKLPEAIFDDTNELNDKDDIKNIANSKMINNSVKKPKSSEKDNQYFIAEHQPEDENFKICVQLDDKSRTNMITQGEKNTKIKEFSLAEMVNEHQIMYYDNTNNNGIPQVDSYKPFPSHGHHHHHSYTNGNHHISIGSDKRSNGYYRNSSNNTTYYHPPPRLQRNRTRTIDHSSRSAGFSSPLNYSDSSFHYENQKRKNEDRGYGGFSSKNQKRYKVSPPRTNNTSSGKIDSYKYTKKIEGPTEEDLRPKLRKEMLEKEKSDAELKYKKSTNVVSPVEKETVNLSLSSSNPSLVSTSLSPSSLVPTLVLPVTNEISSVCLDVTPLPTTIACSTLEKPLCTHCNTLMETSKKQVDLVLFEGCFFPATTISSGPSTSSTTLSSSINRLGKMQFKFSKTQESNICDHCIIQNQKATIDTIMTHLDLFHQLSF